MNRSQSEALNEAVIVDYEIEIGTDKVLHDIGQPIHITTGRRLLQEWTADLGAVVVMLDGALTCRGLVEPAPDLEIAWGAYLGLPQQVLRSGRLADIVDDLVTLRAALRAEHGWIMDTYLLRPSG